MKTFIVLVAAVAVAAAAPAGNTPTLVYGLKRTKKSAYGAPCGGGAPMAPVALYLAPQAGGLSGVHYRENEKTLDEHENHSSRSYYDAGAGLAGISSASASAASPIANLNQPPLSSSGPAVGLFPNAKVGGCAVPLLLSCAPNVVSGHIVKSHGYGSSGYGAPVAAGSAYRDSNALEMKEASEHRWAEAERSATQFNVGTQNMNNHESMQQMSPQGHQARVPSHVDHQNNELTTSL